MTNNLNQSEDSPQDTLDFPFTVSEGSTKAEMELWCTKGRSNSTSKANWNNMLARFTTFQDWLEFQQYLLDIEYISSIKEPTKTTLAESFLVARDLNKIAIVVITGSGGVIATYPVPEIGEEVKLIRNLDKIL